MISKILFLVLAFGISTSAFAEKNLLEDVTYKEDAGTSCFTMVQAMARKNLTTPDSVSFVRPWAHYSITPGTYGQTFISIVAVNNSYYTIVSTGAFSCDSLEMVNAEKIKTP